MPLMRRKLGSSLCCWVIVLCLWKDVSCCESYKNLTVDEGEDVILEVGQTQPQLSDITWNFERHIIAMTRPGQALQLEKYSYRYPGRLFSTDDGSLTITRLMAEDRIIYRAVQFDENWRFLCVQLYDVRENVRGGISPNVDRQEACSPTKPIFHDLGENVTLQLPSHPRVAYVLWDINNIDHIAITQPGGIMHRQDPRYRGKLSVMRDGSLKIFNVTIKDQHVYRAELFTKQWSFLCRQYYDVKLKNRQEACSPTKPIFHDLGENVTLQLPSHPRVAHVLWDMNNIDHIAITQSGGIIHPQDPRYHGRLSVMRDGSLKIFNVTIKDQHVYRAELFTKQWSFLCRQHYDVKLKNISSPGLSSTHGVQNGIRLILSACILLTMISILLYHLKTETSWTPQ